MMTYHGVPVRTVLLDVHVMCDIYVKNCGWIPVECTLKNPELIGTQDSVGHVVSIGSTPQFGIPMMNEGKNKNWYPHWASTKEQELRKEHFTKREDGDKSCEDYAVVTAGSQRPSIWVIEGDNFDGGKWLQSNEITAPGVVGMSEQDKFQAGWK